MHKEYNFFTPYLFFKFIATRYIYSVLVVFGALLALIYLIDLVDIFRRASTRDSIETSFILLLSFLKAGQSVNEILPFCLLFAVLYSYWRMMNFLELSAMQTAGLSKFQLLYPAISVSVLIAILYVTLLTPVFSYMEEHYQRYANQLFGQQTTTISLLGHDLWLREHNLVTQGYTILHTKNARQQGTILHEPDIYLLNEDNQIVVYIKAKQAILQDKKWLAYNATIVEGNIITNNIPEYAIPTNLHKDTIKGSLLGPGSLSFWRLFSYIDFIKKADFTANAYIVKLHYLLSLPFTFIGMTCIGAGFIFRDTPRKRNIFNLFIGIIAGFILYFVYKFLYAFGQANNVPPILTAWAPAFFSMLIGIWMILHLEESS